MPELPRVIVLYEPLNELVETLKVEMFSESSVTWFVET